jgi:hypothetical protein
VSCNQMVLYFEFLVLGCSLYSNHLKIGLSEMEWPFSGPNICPVFKGFFTIIFLVQFKNDPLSWTFSYKRKINYPILCTKWSRLEEKKLCHFIYKPVKASEPFKNRTNVWFLNGFRLPFHFLTQDGHLISGLVRFSNGHCIRMEC